MAVLANVRVLKKRAAHSHLSMRIFSELCAMSDKCRKPVENFVEVMDRGVACALTRGHRGIRLFQRHQICHPIGLCGLQNIFRVVNE